MQWPLDMIEPIWPDISPSVNLQTRPLSLSISDSDQSQWAASLLQRKPTPPSNKWNHPEKKRLFGIFSIILKCLLTLFARELYGWKWTFDNAVSDFVTSSRMCAANLWRRVPWRAIFWPFVICFRVASVAPGCQERTETPATPAFLLTTARTGCPR